MCDAHRQSGATVFYQNGWLLFSNHFFTHAKLVPLQLPHWCGTGLAFVSIAGTVLYYPNSHQRLAMDKSAVLGRAHFGRHLLICGQRIAPLTLIIVIAVVILGMFKVPIIPEFTGGLTPSQTHTRQYFWKPRLAILLIFGLFFGLNQVSTTIDRSIYQVPIANSSIGLKYTLAVGTDPKTHGMYSPQLISSWKSPTTITS